MQNVANRVDQKYTFLLVLSSTDIIDDDPNFKLAETKAFPSKISLIMSLIPNINFSKKTKLPIENHKTIKAKRLHALQHTQKQCEIEREKDITREYISSSLRL